MTAEILEREKAIYRDQALASGKPANVVDKIVDGKMEKFYAEAVPARAAVRQGPRHHDRPA